MDLSQLPEISWYEPLAPQYEIGQKVFYIQHDDNCPAAMAGKRWRETTVLGYSVKMTDYNGELKTLCMGYDLLATKFGDDGNVFFRNELYETEKEVKRLCQWIPVEGITDEEWMQAIGEREGIGGRYAAEDELEKEWDKKDKPWIHYIEADPIDIEVCELGVCCAGISRARDLLIKCSRHSGLIYRDVIRFCMSLIGNGHEEMLHPKNLPVFTKILEKLGITNELVSQLKEQQND